LLVFLYITKKTKQKDIEYNQDNTTFICSETMCILIVSLLSLRPDDLLQNQLDGVGIQNQNQTKSSKLAFGQILPIRIFY